MRCLEPAAPRFAIDAREVDQPGGGRGARKPLRRTTRSSTSRAWARDALALALPAQLLCREDCAGLCPVCGANLNEAGPEHRHEAEPDPRWAKLRELRAASSAACEPRLLVACTAMAVPKQKQSHARTNKRRSQHKISAPTINACPQCHSPRLPHRVCPVCGTYAGRDVVAAGRRTTHEPRPRTARAADHGRRRRERRGPRSGRGRGRRRARGGAGRARAAVRPGGRELGRRPAASRSSTRRSRSRRRPTRRWRCARRPTPRSCRPRKAVADGRADALVSGGSTGAALAAGLFNIKRARGIHRPALALPLPVPGAPGALLDVGANAEVRPEHLVQFAFMGAALRAGGARRRAPARRRCSPTARSRRAARPTSSRRTSGSPSARTARARVRRQRRGRRRSPRASPTSS